MISTITDADHVAEAGESGALYVGALTAPRTITLPPLASMASLAPFIVGADVDGISIERELTVKPRAGDAIADGSPCLTLATRSALTLRAGRSAWLSL